jgi:glucosylceramidase
MKTPNIALLVALGLALACSAPTQDAAGVGRGNDPSTGGGAGVSGGGPPATSGAAAGNVPAASGGGSGTAAVAGGAGAIANAGTGNVGTGGATTTVGGGETTGGKGSTVVPEPQLITSGRDDYWKIGTLTKGGTSATVTVTTASTNRIWDGFGGTFNERGWQVLLGLDPAKQAEVMKKLFDANDGIGFSWGRIPIGPSDYAIERYSFQDSESGAFSIEHDKTASATSKAPLMPFIKAAMAVKSDIKFWGSPWSPPPWMKTGASTAADSMGYDKGSMNKAYLDAYAGYLVNWIKAYEAEGIKISFIVPQNEPGWAQAYPSCAWGSYYDGSTHANGTTYLGDFIVNNLDKAMKAANLTTDIWYGTFSNKDTFTDYWTNLPADKSVVKGVALQWATDEDVGKAIAAGFKVMQSEHKCGNYPFVTPVATSDADANRTNFLKDHAPNNHAYGEESWDLIKSWIDKGVTSYSAWNMVLDKAGFNLDKVRPWPQNALIVVDGTNVRYTAAYYVFRHVAEYVDPGASVLVTDGNALAFKNPDGAVVTIMYNSADQPSGTTLSVDGTLFQVTIPAHGWATVNFKP